MIYGYLPQGHVARFAASCPSGPVSRQCLDGNSLAALIPLPGRPTIRYYGAFAPNAKLRPLVLQAGALAPRRRDKLQAAGHDCQVALTDAELAHHAVEQARQTSGRLSWSAAMKITWKLDTLQSSTLTKNGHGLLTKSGHPLSSLHSLCPRGPGPGPSGEAAARVT